MTELLNRPEVTPDSDELRVDTGELNAMLDAQNPDTNTEASAANAPKYSELSPTGSMLIGAATRINSILERRAVNKAHGEALGEYRERDYNGYIDHLEGVTDSPENSPTANASAQMALDREHLKTDAKEMLEKSKNKIRGFGRSALSRLKGAGLISLGIGVMSAQATSRGAKQSYEVAKSSVSTLSEKAGDGMMATGTKLEQGLDKVGTAMLGAQEKVAGYREKRRNDHDARIDAANERARQAKEAAEKRKAERHKKWADRRDALKQYGQDVKEGFVEAKDATLRGAKFAGNTVKTNTEFAGAATREISREQKAKLGRFAARARAAGEGAVDGWKSV